MGAKVSGVLETDVMLLRVDTTAKKRVVRELFRQARKLRDTARKMAPRDYGALEEAIQMTEEGVGRQRNEAGQFVRTEVDVYIDMEHPAGDPARPDAVVGDYAMEVHEHMEPYGEMQLGEKSLEKQTGQQEVVGGGYMTRAAQSLDVDFDAALELALADLF